MDDAVPTEEADSDSPRTAAVRAAVQAWVNQLIPLSGRNQLLYYRTLKRGTLDLVDSDPQTRADLLNGRTVRLSRLFPWTPERPDREADVNKTATNIHNKSVEAFEERGIGTLFLAYGMATWTSATSSATPAAPILLCPLELDPRGAAEADFDLTLQGDWDINDTLLHLLASEFKVAIDEQPLTDLLEPVPGAAPPLDRVLEEFATRVTGVPAFSITPRIVIGTFAYTKLPMVKDLQNHVESLAEHDLISAIAGVGEAQGSLRELRATNLDPRLPDLLAPADEHLILDADASQNHAINAALGGEPLIIQGPPGTGKSQTIANLITSMAAQGKRVLFVAEKRAAIDAVTKRLRHAGLGDLVLDLHGGVTSKKQLAAELGQTLAAMSQIARVDHTDLHRRLTQERTALDNYAKAMHEVRQPWDISIFDVHQGLIALGDGYAGDLRFVGSRLNNLDAATVSGVRAELTEWAGLTAPINSGRSPWSGAHVHTEDGARQALDLVSDLNSVLPQVSSQLDAVLGATGLAVPESVEAWTEILGLFQAVESTLQDVKPAVYELDLASLTVALEPARHGFFPRLTAQVFKADFRRAKKAVGSVASTGKMSAADACRVANEAKRQASEWSRLGGQGLPRLPGGLDAVTAGFDHLTTQLASLGAFLVTRDLRKQPHRTIREETTRLLTDQQTLFRLPRIHELEQSLQAAHVGPLLDNVRSGATPDGLVGRFDHAWLSSIRTAVTSSDPRLANFDASLHSQLVDGFRADDREHLEITALRVRRAVAERAVAIRNQYPTQETLVKAQSQRKRGHLPLRRLFEQAPDVLTALRPCWVMSPLVVAQTMPARTVFDVVIFDEASQVLPADAISALLRAPQAIVAGDQHQLPPTTFFEGGGDDSGVEDDDGTGLTSGFESVLDVLNALLRNYMLTWHYRSEDERLIAFSNHAIYHGGLTTFPGSVGQERLRHVLIPHRVDASADTRSNNDEVVRVVDLMVEHARTRPTETLGVIAMGIHHANRVEEMLRRRIADERDPDLDRFFDESHEERAFVKNIERVQGDERDAIILTIGYGKQPDGRLFYRFGPLMTEGGERRLNVAVTRARKRVTVVSSFSHTDMDPSRSSALGVELLRQYLKYAESGGTQLDGVRTETPLNPFEIDVQTRLENAGLKLIPQYGQSGFRIDFAVCHPDRPGEMVMAIEADGASYHSSRTVRDRDRLRQQILERLGWKFCRIWSSDWFNYPEAGVAKVMAAYNTALATHDRGPYRPRHVAAAGELPREPVPERPGRSLPRPRVRPGLQIDEYPKPDLVALARWIKSDTLLRTEEQFLEEMMDELGFSRRGTKIVRTLRWAIGQA